MSGSLCNQHASRLSLEQGAKSDLECLLNLPPTCYKTRGDSLSPMREFRLGSVYGGYGGGGDPVSPGQAAMIARCSWPGTVYLRVPTSGRTGVRPRPVPHGVRHNVPEACLQTRQSLDRWPLPGRPPRPLPLLEFFVRSCPTPVVPGTTIPFVSRSPGWRCCRQAFVSLRETCAPASLPIAHSRRTIRSGLRPPVRAAGGDTVQQPPVVRHQHQRAGEFHQAVLQHIERRNIQIVRRFVEDQEVGRLEHQPGDEQSGLFAAGETGDRVDPVAPA